MRSRDGAIVVPVEVTEDVMPGVVSIPHGWGHDLPGVALGVAGEHAGTNSNVLADELLDRAAVRHRRAQRHPDRAGARHCSVSVSLPLLEVSVPRAPA